MSDPIQDKSKYDGHTWTPADFKQPSQQDPEHLDRKTNWTPFQEIITTRQAILDEAKAAITGEREDAYGGPEQSFLTIATLWRAYLDTPIETYDVAAMMALLKIARLKHSDGQHKDSWTDLAGYAACGAECALRDGGEGL